LLLFLFPQQARVQNETERSISNIRKPDKMEMNNVVLEEIISVILLEHPSINKDSLFLLHFWRLFVPKYRQQEGGKLLRFWEIFSDLPWTPISITGTSEPNLDSIQSWDPVEPQQDNCQQTIDLRFWNEMKSYWKGNKSKPLIQFFILVEFSGLGKNRYLYIYKRYRSRVE